MATFANQTVGSHDDSTNEYVEIWWDETWVKAFSFHSVGLKDVCGAYHRVHGVSVEARYIFAAIKAFSNCQLMAVRPDGSTFFTTWVLLADQQTEELRIGDKWGQPIARMRRTGYVQKAA